MGKRRGPGEGSIFEEAPGRWRAVVSLGWRGGKRVRKSFVAKTRREAQRKLVQALREHQLGYNIAPEKRSVEQWLNEWLEQHVRPSVRPNTVRFYETLVRNWLVPHLGQIQLARLTPSHIQQFVNERLAAGVAPKTVRHLQRTLTTALGVAERFGYVPRNVAKLVEPVHVPKPAIRFLTVEQAQAFLAEAKRDRLYALFAVILALGLRLGEALGLRWSDVDLTAGRLTVRYALQRVRPPGQNKRQATLVEPKSQSSRRTIILPAFAMEALLRHRTLQEQERLWAGKQWKGNPWDLVFTTTVGTALDERKVLARFQRLLQGAGLPKLRIHDLRHSAAAILIAAGVPAKAISELLGHSSVAFTLQVYGHLMDEAKQETAKRMQAALGGVAPSLAPFSQPGRVQ